MRTPTIIVGLFFLLFSFRGILYVLHYHRTLGLDHQKSSLGLALTSKDIDEEVAWTSEDSTSDTTKNNGILSTSGRDSQRRQKSSDRNNRKEKKDKPLLTPPKQYLRYTAHSGFGNQMISLTRAVHLARLTNRILLLPPILDGGNNNTKGIAYGGSGDCRNEYETTKNDESKEKTNWGSLKTEQLWATQAVNTYWSVSDKSIGWSDLFDFSNIHSPGGALDVEDSSLANVARVAKGGREYQWSPGAGRFEAFVDLCGKQDIWEMVTLVKKTGADRDVWTGTLFPRGSERNEEFLREWGGAGGSSASTGIAGDNTEVEERKGGACRISSDVNEDSSGNSDQAPMLPLKKNWALKEEPADYCIHYRGGDMLKLYPELKEEQKKALKEWMSSSTKSPSSNSLKDKRILLISDSINDFLQLEEVRDLCGSWNPGEGGRGEFLGASSENANLGANCIGGEGFSFAKQSHKYVAPVVRDWVKCLLSKNYVWLEKQKSTFQATLQRGHDCRRVDGVGKGNG